MLRILRHVIAVMKAILVLLLFLPAVFCVNPFVKFKKDAAAICTEKNTMCLTSKQGYGCCPSEDAVCCADGEHCCAKGFECNVAARKCLQYGDPADYVLTEEMMVIAPMAAHSRELRSVMRHSSRVGPVNLEDVVCPDKMSTCQDNQTCCKHWSGSYACCPGNNAVCCSDMKHCCPEGYQCDTSTNTCIRKISTIATIPLRELLTSVLCPDGKSICDDGETCCLSLNGTYSCCPQPNGVCCSDHTTCCPEGNTCDNEHGTCLKNVICPDGTSECPSGNTCCKTTVPGVYGCCPIPNAKCCSDGVHCCPNGYICDVDACTNSANGKKIPFLNKFPATKPLQDQHVVPTSPYIICPGGRSECANGDTCCPTKQQDVYGCCPVPNAVCCNDHTHCCPKGYTCDVKNGTCYERVIGKKTPLLTKQPAFDLVLTDSKNPMIPLTVIKLTSPTIICPGGESECPNGNTCCILSSGLYGCCPIPKAVCCSDRVHCCPNGYSCDVKEGTCTNEAAGKKTPLLNKQPAIDQVLTDSNNPMIPLTVTKLTSPTIVVCPDGESECPDGNTCCKLSGDLYGCCPLPNAVCCSDGVHCCPNGYSCDVSTCIKGTTGEKTPLLTKQPAIDQVLKNPMRPLAVTKLTSPTIICPDGKSECPNGNTCCKLSGDLYGCCPIPKAVCCSDGVHCCPNGYSCDVKEGTCTDKLTGLTTTVLTKQPAIAQPINVNGVICPNHETECPTNQTCCLSQTGAYACCPLRNATCCPDKKHCCPYSYRCEKETGICTKGIKKLKIKKLSTTTNPLQQTVTCSDGTSCPDNQTCCLLRSEKYGCCPRKDAVCCVDRVHCCPHGYSCVDNKGTCVKGALRVTAHKVTTIVNVMCPDHRSECPSGYTCCKDRDGHFRCCSFANAACCSDGIHCCPEGYKCNIAAHSCDQQWSRIPFLSKSHIRTL